MAIARTAPEFLEATLEDPVFDHDETEPPPLDDASDPTGWDRLSAEIAAAHRNGESQYEKEKTMSLTATAKHRNIYTVPSGTHVGRCYAVIDLGTQDDTYQNRPKIVHKVRVSWEIPALRIKYEEGERPATVHKKYTLSLSEKANLRHDLESWRGRSFTEVELKGFVLKKLLGVPALLGVTHKPNPKGGVYVNVTSVGKMMAGVPCPPAENPIIYFEIEMGKNDVFKDLPEFLQDEISKCAEWRQQPADEQAPEGELEEAPAGASDIPF